MSRYRRPPRRQGVVYGPVLGRDQNQPNIAGRLIGAVVVLGALALMAAATFTFLGRSEPAPIVSPTPTTAALASPTPSLSPTIAPTPTQLPPTPAPTPSPPTAEPTATPFVIEVVEGPGAVTFGRRVDDELRITDPTVNLPNRGRFAWSAELIEPAGDDELTIEIARFDPETAEEEVIASNENDFDDDTIRILRRGRVPRVFDGPGIYVVRYLRDDALLAEGYVQVGD